jgi:hypothetical protein
MDKSQVMQSMELDDEEKLDAVYPMPIKPDYPCGLRGCLTKSELDKLELEPEFAVVGGIIHMHALARITNVNHGENDCRVEFQIEDLAIESEDEENEGY